MVGVQGSGFSGNYVMSESHPSSPMEETSVGLDDGSSCSPNPCPWWQTWGRSVLSVPTRTTTTFPSQAQTALPNQFANLFLSLQQPYTTLSMKVSQLPQTAPAFCRKQVFQGGREGGRTTGHNLNIISSLLMAISHDFSFTTVLTQPWRRIEWETPRQPMSTGEMEGWRGGWWMQPPSSELCLSLLELFILALRNEMVLERRGSSNCNFFRSCSLWFRVVSCHLL